MKNKIWILLILIFILGFLGYNYVYKDHRNVSNESADFTVDVNLLSEEFKNNPETSEKKYLNKTLIITGEITEINKSDLTLSNIVFCDFTETIITNILKLNSSCSIKGRFIGYDDLLEQIKLDQCTLLTK